MKNCSDCKKDYDPTQTHECWVPGNDFAVFVEPEEVAETPVEPETHPAQKKRGRPVVNHTDGLTPSQRWKVKNKERNKVYQRNYMREQRRKKAEAKTSINGEGNSNG